VRIDPTPMSPPAAQERYQPEVGPQVQVSVIPELFGGTEMVFCPEKLGGWGSPVW